ncbi:NAD-dependent epimerase/dehydratase family protein [Roseateles koreensis]|uniref:NAD-dependent epimerase/dehydratase family protein n=1 Tax=Roseateles koreensis TaxID=2987526 RepID=A0ABT5KVD6_9BURK|nr:NAD-dependent epimerase/dehydratase family protein [Roseateles koreensis]MDC8786884.1 NAD-dependent epimerase/dehydratase family protein [Roseateles koreensis]
MRLLILGGTQFVGRHLVEAALAQGHELTLFNRGQSAADLFADTPQIHRLKGDRRDDLSALQHGEWDAVLDCCGYIPREVDASARLLAGRVGQYLYISSVSAYASFAGPNTEASPLGRLADPSTEVVDGASYGPLKAACEAALRQHFAAPLVLRPGLVVGPHDPTQRFTYWPARIAGAASPARAGEPILVPAPCGEPLQFIDARDLAAFALQALARGLAGTFNVACTSGQPTRMALLQACVQAAGLSTEPEWFWAESQALQALGVAPWNDLPLWLPPVSEFAQLMRCDNAAALQEGLQIRPLTETVGDTLRWWQDLPEAERVFTRAGLTPVRERELIKALRSAQCIRCN